MVIIKTIDFKYRNVLYINLKKYNYINNKLIYLEKLDYEFKLQFMAYLFSYIQAHVNNILPQVNNIQEITKEITKENVDNYISTVFNNKQDENNFLSGLEKNLL